MIKICSTPHTAFAAKVLRQQLTTLGYKSIMIDRANTHDRTLHIFIGVLSSWQFPRNYIFWQTEVIESHYFTRRYLDIIQNALAVWEYNADNLKAYSHPNTTVIFPSVIKQPLRKKDFDFVFYGWVNGSDRRRIFLVNLKKHKHLNIRIYNNLLKEEMWNVLARTKVVLNIHYYKNSPLELFRISECFSHNCHVVSEGNDTFWSDVAFANNVEEFVIKANELKDKPFNYDLSKYDNIEKIRQSLENVRKKIYF
jgi:hypothetical protein